MDIKRLIADPKNQSQYFKQKYFESKNFQVDFLDFLQKEQKDTVNGHTDCKKIIENLWSKLDKEVDTEKIVELLQNFDKLVPKIFSNVVIEDLKGS